MPKTTTTEQFFEAEVANHPGMSGFYLLASGEDAFRTRTAITRIAEKTIDAQYFIWEADATGHLMAQQLMLAADRGVRAQFLLEGSSRHILVGFPVKSGASLCRLDTWCVIHACGLV